MSDERIDYEYTGSLKGSRTMATVMYVLGGICAVAGIITAIVLKGDSAMLLILIAAMGVLCGVILAVVGLGISKTEWFWNDEKFTAMQMNGQPATYNWTDIRNVMVNNQGAMIYLNDGKNLFVSRMAGEFESFLNVLKSHLN